MKINWKVRFRNKTWLSLFISAILAVLYIILEAFGVFPELSEGTVLRLVEAFLMILSLIGVIVDPTTAGLDDSARAQRYSEPWDDDLPEGGNG